MPVTKAPIATKASLDSDSNAMAHHSRMVFGVQMIIRTIVVSQGSSDHSAVSLHRHRPSSRHHDLGY
jgi:hypothetical protein